MVSDSGKGIPKILQYIFGSSYQSSRNKTQRNIAEASLNKFESQRVNIVEDTSKAYDEIPNIYGKPITVGNSLKLKGFL